VRRAIRNESLLRRVLTAVVVAAALVPAGLASGRAGGTAQVGYLLDGTWLFRPGHGNYSNSRSVVGWTQVSVPNAWNAGDYSLQSFNGTIGWYRKDFHLPAGSGFTWLVRFESVNNRVKAYLNGHLIGTHTGPDFPFELVLPPKYLAHGGAANRLVLRVDDRRGAYDLPPSGQSILTGEPLGGWWNFGGILRDVYLRRIDRVDMQTVQVLPTLRCVTCDATIAYRIILRNWSRSPQHVALSTRFGTSAASLGSVTIGPGSQRELVHHVTVAHPQLWDIHNPHLYDVTIGATVNGRPVQHWFLRSGIRTIVVSPSGQLLLNGHQLDFRGVGLHEFDVRYGAAIPNAVIDRYISEIKSLGATAIRVHYPYNPYLLEQADANGILVWSEIPMYSIKSQYIHLATPTALADLRQDIYDQSSHPSVMLWSIANELSPKPKGAQVSYIARAVSLAHSLDPTRPVGLAVQGYPSVACQPAYAPLEVIGINDYFGWYIGPDGQIADPELLPDYLNQVRTCYPHKAIVVSEFGAEADRNGPVEERGTYQFQQNFINSNFAAFANAPWLSGAIYWTLEDFQVRPDWIGGNAHPNPPTFEKGLISEAGQRKPGYQTFAQDTAGVVQMR
jgi:Glycosyl hydrolases family 2, TIM barrel domain/Glycosyl hydrolases family 2, sugar binding domain/Glycosyl hydrolases family 2